MLQLRTAKDGASVSRRSVSDGKVPAQIMDVIHAVEKNDSLRLSHAMTRLIRDASLLGLPKQFLKDTQLALGTGDWSRLGRALRDFGFVGAQGNFLLVAPYTISREVPDKTRLSAVYGIRLSLGEIPATKPTLHDLFGEVRQQIPQMVPFRAIAGAGWFAGEAGEAFLVPNGWPGLTNGAGPVLNNMSEQLVRVGRGAFEAIKTIFNEPSSALLLSVYVPQSKLMTALNAEYSFHEAGHASGIGLNTKLDVGVLSSPFYGAAEEWRADGVAFEVARRLLPVESAGALIASNLITRFGIDAHRKGALDLDTDVNTALLTFQSLIESGLLTVHQDNRLGLVDATFSGLVRATELMCAHTISLTRREMQLPNTRGVATLYADVIAVPESVRLLFRQTIINPCRGLYRELR